MTTTPATPTPAPAPAPAPTQVRRPWQATLRSIIQFAVGLAASWAVIVQAAGLHDTTGWLALSVAVAAAITRIMALSQVEALLARFLPFLSAAGRNGTGSDAGHVDVPLITLSGLIALTVVVCLAVL